MTPDFDPVGAVEFIDRHFGQVSVMAFEKSGRCLRPCVPGPVAASAFIAQNLDNDIYFVPGDLLDPDMLGKPQKIHMGGSRFAWVDLDPPKAMKDPAELERWRAQKLKEFDRSGLPRPHVKICSGRGLWLFWRLSRPVDVEEAEAISRALAQRLGGDKCHNIDRVARVPFTRNSKTGIVATVLREVDGVIAPEALPHSAPDPAPALSVSSELEVGASLASLDDLDCWNVDNRLRRVIDQGRDPENPKQGDDSRSAWVWDCIMGLLRHGVPEETILAILLDRRWGISASIYDNSREARDYAVRQIERAREYLSDFVRDDKGRIVRNYQHNIRLALTKMGISLSYDMFARKNLINGLAGFGPALGDYAVRRLWFQTHERFGFQPAKDFFWEAILDIAARESFHPVLDYLETHRWDGKHRLDNWLISYASAPDTPYVRAVSAIILIAAVRRVRQPGVKFDEMLVLEGEQGTCKSTALSILAGDPAWFSDSCPFNADGREVIEALSGKWIVEAGELAGLRKASAEKLKAFQSRTIDHGRAAYGRIPEAHPRQCVFFGSTNNAAYLNDSTGNRRFWPVKIDRFDLEALSRDRDQLWAEAAAREAAGESIRMEPSLWADAAAEQETRRVEDPIVSALAASLGNVTGRIRSADVWKLLDIPLAQQTAMNRLVGNAMQELGWQRRKSRFGGPNPEWTYERGTDAERRTRLSVSFHNQVVPWHLSSVQEAAA